MRSSRVTANLCRPLSRTTELTSREGRLKMHDPEDFLLASNSIISSKTSVISEGSTWSLASDLFKVHQTVDTAGLVVALPLISGSPKGSH